jgi:polysaccharide export outer membrane protein
MIDRIEPLQRPHPLPVRNALTAMIAGIVLALAACGGTVRPTVENTAPDANAQSEYHIGAGDALNIFVLNHADLSQQVPVRPDGLISTPLIEDMRAAGKTPSELARDMEKALSDYVRSPKVNVIVTTFVGTYADQIRVVGQAAHPQALPFKAGMTLLDVMIQVGGLAEFAAGNRARLVRRVEGKEITFRVKLDDLLHKGEIKANMPVKPGDVLIIPESRF